MSSENNTTYKLNFINKNEFEILLINKAETLAIKHLLDSADFVENVVIGIELDPHFPDKLTGETSSEENLIKLLNDWDALMANQTVTTYSDFEEDGN